MSKRKLIVGTLLVAVFCLLAGAAMGECHKIKLNGKPGGGYIAGCDGYDHCEYGDVVGTLNGVYWARYNDDDLEVVGDALLVSADSVLKTKHGDVWLDEKDVYNLNIGTGRGFGQSISILGGSGKYEGVTGYLAGYLFVPVTGNSSELRGEICWPEEE